MSSLLRFRQGIVVLFLAALTPVQLYGQPVELDSDADGLIDAWEIQHFGSLNHPDGAANLDPDEDTCTNLKECQDGTDPNDREDCLKAAKTILKPGELAITWNTRLGKRYQIELSDDLQTWKPVSDTAGTTPLNWFGTGGQLTGSVRPLGRNPGDLAPWVLKWIDRRPAQAHQSKP